jgi:peptidoglycan-associated lipoprotein
MVKNFSLSAGPARVVGAFGLAMALAACASTPKEPPPVVNTPPPQVEAPRTAPPQVAPRGPVPGSMEDFLASAQERVFFDTDMYNLTAEARGTLDRQAAWLKRYPAVTVLIAGSADERGTREYNLALGARRAQSVKDYLVQLGVAPNRVETVSYGKERPFDPRNTPEAWALNRNAQTQLRSGAVS